MQMVGVRNDQLVTGGLPMTDHLESLFQSLASGENKCPPQRHREHKGRIEKSMSTALNKPGLLESSYRKSFYRELSIRHIPFQRELPLPLNYKGLRLDCGYRMDAVVARQIVVEVKSVVALAPIHEAQLLTYLKIGGYRLGLLINFNVLVLKDGIRRKIVGYDN